MARKPSAKPTDAELAILGVLWEHGPSTVRRVHEELQRSDPVRYTTTLKQMQVMFEKGLLERDESKRAHVYRPALPQGQMRRRLVADFLERAFGGSAAMMVAALLDTRPVSRRELEEIKRLIAQREKEEER